MNKISAPKSADLLEISPLIKAGKWSEVDRILDRDYAEKCARDAQKHSVLPSQNRLEALSEALIAAVKADRRETVARILRLEDYSFVHFVKARQIAAEQTNFKMMRVFDQFVERGPDLMQNVFSKGLAPLTDTRVQADRLSRLRKKRRPRL